MGEPYTVPSIVLVLARTIATLKELLMDAVQQLTEDLTAAQTSMAKTAKEIEATKALVTTLQSTIADLEAQLANAAVPQSLLDLGASLRQQAQAIDDQLPDLPPTQG